MMSWYALFVSAAWKSTAVLGAAWLVTQLMRRASAASRHIVWTAAFTALLALPLLVVSLPAWEGPPVPGVLFRATTISTAVQPAVSAGAVAPGTAGHPAPVPANWRECVAVLWMCGVTLSLAQISIAWIGMWRRRLKARPFAGIGGNGVEILEAAPGSMPMTFGLFRPAIFVPADAADWSSERFETVVLHERAHIERGDPATHLLARFALSLYWWNPLAWIAWRQFIRERERAADDLVLAAGVSAPDYAGHLLEIARAMQTRPALGWAAVAMARRSQLEGRLLAILDARRNRKATRPALRWITAIAAIALIAPLAALRAQDTQTVPADVDATIRAAAAQKNHEMLDGAAKAAEVYRKYDLARKLLDSSLAIREEQAGQQSVQYGLGLVKIGDLERTRGNIAEAQAFYTKAANVLGNRPEAAPVLIDLGMLAMRGPNVPGTVSLEQAASSRDLEPAFNYFQQAQAADPAKAGQATMWMAIVRDQQKNGDAADQLFQQALASQDPKSAGAATTMGVYAAFLQRQGRTAQADDLKKQADGIKAGLLSTQYRNAVGGSVFRVGNDVTAPSLAYKVEPQYTEEARAARYQGTVVVGVTVGTDGTAQNMRVIRSLGLGLDEKALQAISQWKFKPGTKGGQPVPVQATIEVNFRLL